MIRADGTFLYTFTSVIDDIDFGVTHVLRGEDYVTNTGVQIQLFEAMGHGPPAFAHHNLLVGRDGHALSKRDKSLSVASLREAGLEPMAVACHAALVGTSDAVEPLASLDELAARLDLARISTAPARFDPAELAALNARLLHRLPYASVARRLAVLEVGGGEPLWLAVRGNLSVLADARTWWRIVADEITPVIEDAATRRAAELLPPEPWDEGTAGLDAGGERGDGRQGPGAVPSAAAGASRAARPARSSRPCCRSSAARARNDASGDWPADYGRLLSAGAAGALVGRRRAGRTGRGRHRRLRHVLRLLARAALHELRGSGKRS